MYTMETDNICLNRNILQLYYNQAARHKENQPTPEKFRHFNEAQKYRVQSYEKEETDYVQNKISEIKNAMCN